MAATTAAADPVSATRRSSSDSSALSNIFVASAELLDQASDTYPVSTPPTSVNDSGSLDSSSGPNNGNGSGAGAKDDMLGRRSKRVRSGVSSYNLKKLADAQNASDSPSSAPGSRNVSGLTGRTLVAGEEEQEIDQVQRDDAFGKNVEKALDMDWELDAPPAGSPARRSPRKHVRRPSVKDRVKKAVVKVGSVLGKRGREVVETGKRKLGMIEESPKQDKVKRELDMGKGGVLDELDLDAEFALPPPKKKQKLSKSVPPPNFVPAPLQKTSDGRKVKKWQAQGLYVGQSLDKAVQKKRPASSSSAAEPSASPESKKTSQPGFMTLPMFNYLDKTRNFTIPFDVYAPISKRGDEKPKDWHKVNRNRLIGDAKEIWAQTEKLQASVCVCTPPGPGEQGCGEDCLNRIMQYECNGDYCNLDAETCSNRAFADLAARVKKAGAYDVGVEVIKTSQCGFGVRSCRTFAPGQIIMEYTGEIISEGECQRRMQEEYKDKQCYYLMELERGLVIDGTKGSMARFINHSCAPNCEVRMMKVNGYPRMAVFAGDDGIMTGEELTYDYNFDNFGTTHQKCYCGAPTCRGFLSKRLNAVELKKMLKEEAEKSRKKAEEAQKRAVAEAQKKQAQADRGAAWKGWLAVDDPEVKERLRAEKKAREEASNNSSRAKRLAARRETLPATAGATQERSHELSPKKRRKTAHGVIEQPTTRPSAVSLDRKDEVSPTPPIPITKQPSSGNKKKRTTSTGSRFAEDLPSNDSKRSVSAQTFASTIIHETTTEPTTTSETARLLDDTDFSTDNDAIRVGRKGEAEEEDATIVVGHKSRGLGFSSTAAKGKEALRTVGQALKGGLKTAHGSSSTSSSSQAGAGASRLGPQQPTKLKQSRLSFAKLS